MNQDIKKIICFKKTDHSPIPFSLIINIVQSLIFTEDPKLLRSAANVTMEVLNLGQESKKKTLKKENIFVDSRIYCFPTVSTRVFMTTSVLKNLLTVWHPFCLQCFELVWI